MKVLVSIALCALAGCSDRSSSKQPANSEPQRRVIEPPSGTVRPMPPHAIRSEGIGPYKLGERLSSLLAQLASGPRIARLEIPGLLHLSVIRAEDDFVLIGGEPTPSVTSSTATFVAVFGGAEVARTEKGDIHVGSSRAQLEAALGPFVADLDRATDPRLVLPSALRNARIIIERDRVNAIAIIAETARPTIADDSAAGPACPRPESTEGAIGACLVPGTGGELIEHEGDEIVIRSLDAPEPAGSGDKRSRVIATLKVPNTVFVAPLRNASEGRDELVMITRTDEQQVKTWSLVAYRVEGRQMVRVVDPEPRYQVSATQLRWIGAELQDVELYLELASRPDGIEVGGLLTTRPNNKLRDVVVISPVVVARRHGKSATEPVPDGRPDAGSARP